MNYYNVSSKEALQAGRMNLKYIPLGLMFSGGIAVLVLMIPGLFFGESLFSNTTMHVDQPWMFFTLPLAGVVASFAWRSFHSAAWKIYVLENVQDVHRAFKLAESEGMIYSPNNVLHKLEYRAADQRERLAMLEIRLEQPRIFEAATGTPAYEEQSFGYAYRMAAGQSLTIVGFFAGVYYFTNRESADFPPFVFLFPVGILAFLAYRWVPRFNGPPPIRFDAQQLTLENHPPVLWTNINHIFTEMRKSGKSRIPWLVVQYVGGGSHELALNEIDGSPTDIEDSLYQQWALAQQKSQTRP